MKTVTATPGVGEPLGCLERGAKAVFHSKTPGELTLWRDGRQDEPTCCVLRAESGAYTAEFFAAETGLYFYRLTTPQGDVPPSGAFQITVFEPRALPRGFCGGTMYQIFPDRFCRSGAPKSDVPGDRRVDPKMSRPPFLPDADGRYNNDYYGGDLEGVRSRLPYLRSLGVTIIYLNPIFEAHSNHRYDTANYLKIDPLLGTQADFERLCRDAHAAGMKVILDGVFSHTGADSVYFDKNGRYGSGGAWGNPHSRWRSWYKWDADGVGYKGWWGVPTLPETNERDPDFAEFICGERGVLAHWLRAGADGFRLDVADELPDEFIRRIRERLDAFGDRLLIGEVWEDASNKISYSQRRRYFLGDELHGVMNYPLRSAIIDFLKDGAAAPLADTVATLYGHYPPAARALTMNILSTHDTPRLLTALAAPPLMDKAQQASYTLPRGEYLRAVELAKLAFVLLFTLPGIPCVYYGDEKGMQGFGDPFCRGVFDNEEGVAALRELVAHLGRLRAGCDAFAGGDYRELRRDGGAFAFVRSGERQRALIAVNRGDAPVLVSFEGREYFVPPWQYVVEIIK